jgi:isochorismate hydrolase
VAPKSSSAAYSHITVSMLDGVSCIDGYIRNFQMSMIADALGDYSEPEHRMAVQCVAQI